MCEKNPTFGISGSHCVMRLFPLRVATGDFKTEEILRCFIQNANHNRSPRYLKSLVRIHEQRKIRAFAIYFSLHLSMYLPIRKKKKKKKKKKIVLKTMFVYFDQRQVNTGRNNTWGHVVNNKINNFRNGIAFMSETLLTYLAYRPYCFAIKHLHQWPNLVYNNTIDNITEWRIWLWWLAASQFL